MSRRERLLDAAAHALARGVVKDGHDFTVDFLDNGSTAHVTTTESPSVTYALTVSTEDIIVRRRYGNGDWESGFPDPSYGFHSILNEKGEIRGFTFRHGIHRSTPLT